MDNKLLDEINEKTPILDLVSEFVSLRRIRLDFARI